MNHAGKIAAVATFLAILTLVASALMCAYRPLWFDELFTFYVAREPTAEATVAAMRLGVDNLPPLDHLMRHFTMRALGQSPIAFRAVSLIGYGLAIAGLYGLLRTTASPLSALAASAALPLSRALHYAAEARPYAWLLTTAIGALYFWTHLHRGSKRPHHAALLSLCLGAGPLLHYYGVMGFVPIAAAEAVAFFLTRRIRLRILISLIAGVLISALTTPFALAATAYSGKHWTSVNVGAAIAAYGQLMTELPTAIAFMSIAALVTSALWRETKPNDSAKLDPAFIAGVCAMAALPFVLYFIALITEAMNPRYAIATTGGIALLVGCLVFMVERSRPRIALALVGTLAVLALYQGVRTAKNALEHRRQDPAKNALALLERDEGVIVIENPHLFLKSYYYLPKAHRARIAYPVSAAHAVRYLGHDTNERAMEKLAKLLSFRTLTPQTFSQLKLPFLLVVEYGWVTPWLIERGATLRMLPPYAGRGVARVESVP